MFPNGVNERSYTNFRTNCVNAANLVHLVSLIHIPLFSCPNDHVTVLANLFTVHKPSCYSQAKTNKVWIEAMNKELTTLELNQTWELTTLPPGHKALPSTWVYNVKFKGDGSIDRPKARLVITGFNQQIGIDYKYTFAAVAKLATVKVIIALSVVRSWPLHQLHVNNAFPHGYFDEVIYMLPP